MRSMPSICWVLGNRGFLSVVFFWRWRSVHQIGASLEQISFDIVLALRHRLVVELGIFCSFGTPYTYFKDLKTPHHWYRNHGRRMGLAHPGICFPESTKGLQMPQHTPGFGNCWRRHRWRRWTSSSQKRLFVLVECLTDRYPFFSLQI